ncbi:hypothetical protein [Gordonia paraffinivorans]|uniref:hypothetical protein n=1 Tax=Gordonia paraffinivorans TaxID=175628 RepID=UPI0013EFA2D8|nr:hypothetical protein [Gordonia paraffinivorans]
MTSPAAPHRPKKYALISGVALVVIAVIVGVVFAVRAATGDAPRWSDPSADTLPDLSSAPEDPRWTFDLGQGFWFPRFIGGNENVVARGPGATTLRPRSPSSTPGPESASRRWTRRTTAPNSGRARSPSPTRPRHVSSKG